MAKKGTEYYGLRRGLGQTADILRDIEAGILPTTVPPGNGAPAPAVEPMILGIPQGWFWIGVGVLGLIWLSRR